MSGRGRGRPNLALAGKREEPAAQKANSSSNGRARGRGRGRGRGAVRGGRDQHQKPGLIQTGGVFSEGLSGGVQGPKKRERDESLPTISVMRKDEKRINNEAEAPKSAPSTGDGKSSFDAYEKLWESDEDADREELTELLRDNFMTGHRRGTIMPLVLPKDDERQFVEVMHSKVKEEILSDDEDRKHEPDFDSPKKKILTDVLRTSVREQLARSVEEELDPLLKYSRKAAAAIRTLPIDDKEPAFLMIQLPSVVESLCRQHSDAKVAAENDAKRMEVDGEPVPETKEAPPTAGLPQGETIGKLQITRQGRVLLKIHDYTMDVTKTIPGGQQEAVVLLESPAEEAASLSSPQRQPQTSLISPLATQNNGDAQRRKANGSALYHLGSIRHHLMASMTWAQLDHHVDQRRPQAKKEDCEDVDMECDEAPQKVQTDFAEFEKTLKDLEKTQKGWAKLANQWAGGCGK